MGEEVPRRLRRFYRTNPNGAEPQGQVGPQPYREENVSENPSGFGQVSEEDFNFEDAKIPSEERKPVLGRIPSMNYEDLDEKNAREIQKVEKQNAENQLALSEVEKFKQENKRMPTKQETEKIAETLYTQLKDNPVDYSSVGGEAQEPSPQRMSPSQRRMQRANARQDPGKMQQGFTSTQSGTQNIGQFSTPSEEMNVKDLLSEESEKKSKKGDDFDLGMGEDLENSQSANEGSGPESIEDIGEVNLDENSESCPNCKKPTDKVIYCPKCGFAFCKSCAKLVLGNEVTCPKCGNKTKV